MVKITQDKPMMGTIIQITVQIGAKDSRVKAMDAIEKAFEQFTHVIKVFSRFDEKSELSKLNKSQGRWFKTSKELFTLVETALDLSKQTNYIYDPTIIDVLTVYGYDKSFDVKRISEMVNKPSLSAELKEVFKNRPKVSEIELNKEALEIKLAKRQRIDLGSLAKGYAIDLASEVLISKGYKDFIVNAGGDIRARGKKKVALFDARNPENPGEMIEIKDQAIAGSGNFAKQVDIFNHIINPVVKGKTEIEAKRSERILQTYTIAPTAMEADMWSTALFLLGEQGLKLLNKKGFKGMIITNQKRHTNY